MNDELSDTLNLLAEIINKSYRSEDGNPPTAKVPVALLKQARAMMEGFRDTEYSTSAIKHASNRVWGS